MNRILLIGLLLLSVGLSAENFMPVMMPDSQLVVTLPRTTRAGNRYYVNDTLMRRGQYQAYLKRTCVPAYEYFRSGRMMAQSGWGLSGVGGALVLTSIPFLLTDVSYVSSIIQIYIGLPVPTPVESIVNFRVGLITILSGAACLAGGVTLISLGNARQHDAANIYNAKAFKDYPTYWTISTNSSGLGVAYHF